MSISQSNRWISVVLSWLAVLSFGCALVAAQSPGLEGNLDAAFGREGKVIIDLGDSDYANSLAIQADGKIVVVGRIFVGQEKIGGPRDKGGIMRFNPDGSPDLTFGSGGKVIEDSVADSLVQRAQ